MATNHNDDGSSEGEEELPEWGKWENCQLQFLNVFTPFCFGIMVFGFFFFGAYFVVYMPYNDVTNNWLSAQCNIVNLRPSFLNESCSTFNLKECIGIEVEYQNASAVDVVVDLVVIKDPKFVDGGSLNCWYNPKDSTHVIFERKMDWTSFYILLAGAIAGPIIGVICFIKFRREEKEFERKMSEQNQRVVMPNYVVAPLPSKTRV